ncbi:hypothetical protein BKA70DRAFT_1436345 [Coprinopsis sp. MPI-PUGE-AT-0042]|nr:hypothetical protein BKA70DRAFT_1436345 [Coprinopsis sp. MPI-PUGE-AT-0042]
MVMPRDLFATVHGPVGCWMRREGTTWPGLGARYPGSNAASASGDTEIVEWDDDETDDEMPPLEPINY